jgi:anti-sigma factor RsiW
MNHQPFESWLLSEDDLDKDQSQSLRDHLANCERCASAEASWNEVQQLFDTTPQVTPAVGFATRWQARQAERTHLRQQRQSWILFGGIAAGSFVLLVMLIIQVVPVLRSPENLVLFIIYRLASLSAYVRAAQNLVFSLLGTIIPLVPSPVWIGLFGMFSMICVLWFVVLKQLSYSRSINL